MMRLGILVDERQAYFKWQYRLLQEISQYEHIALQVVINHHTLEHLKSMVDLIMMLQEWIESQMLAIKTNHLVGKITDSKNLKTIPHIKLDQRDSPPILDAAIARIRTFELDLIVDFTCRPIRDLPSTLAKRGIWSIQHGTSPYQISKWAGLLDMINRQPITPIKLIEVEPAGRANLIDESFHFVHWSLAQNKTQLIEQASILLDKHLRRETNAASQRAIALPLERAIGPSFTHMIHYLIYFYRSLAAKAYRKVATKYWGKRYRCWSLLVGKGALVSTDPHTAQSIIPPPGEFWADPFLFEDAKGVYLFFENFNLQNKIGKISCTEVKGSVIGEVQDVLVKDFHLSYPFLCVEDGSIFMIPETSANRRLEIYRCVEMPNRWELFTTAFEGEPIADASYFEDDAGKRWLFVNKGVDDFFNDQLHIYQIDSLSLKTITPHRQNPVIIDARRARNAGPIFRSGSQFIRPSQNNSYGTYGYGLNLNVIKKLSLDHYEEEVVHKVTPESHIRFKSCHHLHQTKDRFVMDAITDD